ncbi:hypothetical protein MMC18_002992 [Xylographa bjoerkii]|nr:hypothetical protein [Xylographa bjoerkii]
MVRAPSKKCDIVSQPTSEAPLRLATSSTDTWSRNPGKVQKMETVPSKTARMKSALRQFSNHDVLRSRRTDDSDRSTENLLNVQSIPRKPIKTKSALHRSSSVDSLGARQTDDSKRSTRNILSVKTITRGLMQTKPALHHSNSIETVDTRRMDKVVRRDRKFSSLEGVSENLGKKISALHVPKNHDTPRASPTAISAPSGRDVANLSPASARPLRQSSSCDTFSTRRTDNGGRSSRCLPHVETVPNDPTKTSFKLPVAFHSGTRGVTNDTFAHSSKIKLNKHECLIFESAKEYLQGKKLNLSQLQDFKKQLSKPHTCSVVFRKNCRDACLLALQKTLNDIGIKVSLPSRAAAMGPTEARRTGRSRNGSLSSVSSSNHGKTSFTQEDVRARDKAKKGPAVPHDAGKIGPPLKTEIVPVAISNGSLRPKFVLGGALPHSTLQPTPEAKVPKSITAHAKKKSRAEARRYLSVLPEAEEPHEAGSPAAPLMKAEEAGASRVRIGLQPSDEETWRRYAITAESLSALD